MTARRVSLVLVALLITVMLGWMIGRQQLRLTFVVPDEFSGYLLTRWQCPGGLELARNLVGSWSAQTIQFDATGTACISGSIPRAGFVIEDFEYTDASAAPVIVGGTHRWSGPGGPEDADVVVSPLASIGIGNGQILGDERSSRDELAARFGLSARVPGGVCDPIYVSPNPGIPLTPGIPSGPD